MALSNQSMNKIASAMVQEVVEELYESDEWMDFLYTNIGGIIVGKLGQIDDTVLAELIMGVADRISLKAHT
jgi:hypothetical protein